MKFHLLILVSLFTWTLPAKAQDKTSEKEYEFILQDSPSILFTMQQFNQNYLSTYRLAVGEMNKVFPKKVSQSIQVLASAIFLLPLTHEEGHRSILSKEGIGSISKPYFNKHLAAYVKGVKNSDLINLRDNNLPVFIRLHTAGLESDYALIRQQENLLSWRKESKDVLFFEYFLRKISLVSYLSSPLFKIKINIKEEANEQDRDIVGHDVYGAIRHLHRPNEEFYRYTKYDDLTSIEKKFANRLGWRSLLNFINPIMIGKTGFDLNDGIKLNVGLGYGMAPFGDFIDENFWVSIYNINSHIYIRQYQNKSTWFPEIGVNLHNINLYKNIYANVKLYGWNQPEKLGFNESKGDLGGAIDILLKYRFNKVSDNRFKGISINVGLIAKSKGFLVENLYLENKVGLQIGTSIYLN